MSAIDAVSNLGGAGQALTLSRRAPGQLAATAKEFEAMMASQLMAPMFETMDVDPMFGGGAGEEAFRGLMVQEYGKVAAGSGTLGISSQLQTMMLRMQGGAS